MTTFDNTTDVLVIGSGMGGAAVSKRLSDAGIRVTCLEQGDWVHPTQFPHFHDEWEIEKYRSWAFDPNLRQNPEDYPITGLTSPRLMNVVGGSTVHYAGHWFRYKPVDFRKGTEHGVGGTIDWPISYEDLAPYYDINDAEVGISGLAGDPMYPPRPAPGGPPIKPGKGGRRMAEAWQRLGWQWWPTENAILTRGQDGRFSCNSCGNCLSGCPRGSLGSADVAYWPKALRNGVDLRTFARVESITTRNGRATGAIYIDRLTGARHEIKADLVVLAANGVGSPRLLLMSAQKGHPDGLCNSNGMVGTHLMHHTWSFADMWFEDPIEGYKGAVGCSVHSQQFYDTDASHDFVNGMTFLTLGSFGAAYSAMGTHTAAPDPWGAAHRPSFNKHFGHHVVSFMQGDDIPRPENRVTLDPSAIDSSGLPAAHIEYSLGENDISLATFGTERLKEAAEAAGATETNITGPMHPPPAWHLMGTCRMGNTPDDSVVNAYNQSWEVPNLFIVDGSSLTTGAAVNPTSTIGALAVRCAEYIKRNHRQILSQTKTQTKELSPAL
ncbi:GMC family oxidoreductase [Kribbella turkmenica]|uniref:GMC family oxidoreductase n=1 Tax=Kribbella turkmenica TaxID=2530375 RepID=A0A4R4XGT3_9ACTN|nr:GMC family oxidoreductase [Kribbella turkmenica]TDD30005.1 GMC family oxidoreductase [Kribbella turkmenica]